MTRALALLWLALGGAAAHAACPASTKEAITRQYEEWNRAYEARDLEGVMRIFSPTVVSSFQGRADAGYGRLRADYQTSFAAPPSGASWHEQLEQIDCSGELAYIVATFAKTERRDGKTAETQRNRSLDVLRREDGAWRITRSIFYPALPVDADPRQAFAELMTAGRDRDVATLARLYAAAYFHVNADGSTMSREQVLASYRAPAPAAAVAVTHDDDEWEVSRYTAVVSSRITSAAAAGNAAPTRSYRVTYVFTRTAQGWVAVCSHASLLLTAEGKPYAPRSR
ncbi:MAG TPA: nuclear transport factor 2 family protein [Thermoanaerobaculia bacterium]|jgi:uncharacterized protein (TIGR02246 family)|nr:nuclear transport factor 2 family protein [Thermoanaerobaculia bacterium]